MVPPPHVLVVDDEPALARCLATFLNARGFHAETAGDALGALERLQERRWDVVVVDLKLGHGLRGDELLDAAAAADPDLPGRTIFMTGDASHEAQGRIGATGCNFYLQKPFSLVLLLDAVRGLVGGEAAAERRRQQESA